MKKTVLITGSSTGYGRATAILFLERGWNVVATMRSPEKADFPAHEHLRAVRLDVTDRTSITAAIQEAIQAFGAIDAVVNNAGIGLLAPLEMTPDQTMRELFETNTFGVMAVSQAIAPYFRERRSGTLINVTSSAALVAMPLVSVYTASKFAVEGFTESLAYELSAFGVRTKLVEPGYGPGTAFIANSGGRMNGLLTHEAYAPYVNQLMGGHAEAKATTSAEDVARVVYEAATDESDRLRYAAGKDAEELAALRKAMPGDDYLPTMRAMVGPK